MSPEQEISDSLEVQRTLETIALLAHILSQIKIRKNSVPQLKEIKHKIEQDIVTLYSHINLAELTAQPTQETQHDQP